MTRKGLLLRTQTGRTAHYTLSPSSEELLRQGARRVDAEEPFGHPDGQWTLLSYSMPESRRDLRHQVRAALTWAGFGGLRDGLWIAPGAVDVAGVFADAHLAEVAGIAECFSAAPLPGTDVAAFIQRAWPIDRIRERHEAFLQAWSEESGEADPLVQLTRLNADWLQVLRADPGLPARYLSPDWPAARSAAVYRRSCDRLEPAATAELDAELRPRGRRRAS
jgi:phenylacetic acid degradation operon negative regulatory protein